MARILTSIGITDIRQFGQIPQYEQLDTYHSYSGRPAYQTQDGTWAYTLGPSDRKAGTEVPVPGGKENVQTQYGYMDGGQFTPVDPAKVEFDNGVPIAATGQSVYGNKLTNQSVPNTYSERQTGNAWGGTFAGKGNTGYRVQFTPDGMPIFYTSYASSNDLANLMQDLGPVGQIAIAVATGGLSIPQQIAAQMAIQLLSGGDLEDAIKGAAISLAVSNIPGADFMKDGASYLNGIDSSGVLTRSFQTAATSATKAILTGQDISDALLSGAVSGGVSGAVDFMAKGIDGFENLSSAEKAAAKTAMTSIISGKPLDQVLINSAISAANAQIKVEKDNKAAKDAGWADYATQQAAKLTYGDKVTPDLYTDKQETTEAEAKDIARGILGREPTEFEYMQLIGLPENEATKNSDLSGIRYDEDTFDSNELAESYKAVYGKEPTAEWLASDEAMDMLGRSEAQGKNILQNLHVKEQNDIIKKQNDIIKDKNWVTEDEAQQFWKDTGNTGPVPQEFMDSMLMTSEDGARAMAETHRINAEDIAATTFDGSQYETPQEAAAAAKAAGFNAFTHKDKNLTYFTQPSPVKEAEARANVEEKKTFNEAFAAARKELGAGKTFTWNGKQYTTNVMPKDTFDASRSSTITTAATLALANGKEKFIGPDGKTYKLDDKAKSVLANSVNQSAAETQRLLNLKPTTDETPAETQRLMEAGTRGTMDTIGAMTAQALGTTQRGLGNFLSNAGKTYAAITGDFDFDNAAIRLGKEIETYAKGNDIYGLDVQKNRMSQAIKLADETDDWIEKNKILGSAISKNKIGFFDIAGSEVVEGLPETALQIGVALMTGGTTLAAKGVIATIGAVGSVFETFGSTAEDTYNKAKKAGFSDAEAKDKAYTSAAIGTAIEATANFVADKALLAPFLNKFTGTLAGTAAGFVSSTAIGAVSNLAAGMGQSFTTQYLVNPETASLSKAATDGFFEMYIGGAAQGTMGLPGYAIQGGSIIGKDYFGKDLTVADVAAGAILDSSTVNPNATIATSEDGDPVTLGGAMLQMPNYQFDMSTLKTYVPQVFQNDNLIVGQDELGNDVTFGELMGQTTESKGFDEVYKSLLDITPQQRAERTTLDTSTPEVAPPENLAADPAFVGPRLPGETVDSAQGATENPFGPLGTPTLEEIMSGLQPLTNTIPPAEELPVVKPTDTTPPVVTPPTGSEVVAVDPDEGTALVVDGNGNATVVDNTDGTLVTGDVVPADTTTPPTDNTTNLPVNTPPTGSEVVAVDPDTGTALVVDGSGNVNVVDNTDGTLTTGDTIQTGTTTTTGDGTTTTTAPAANVTPEQVTQIVNDAIKANPGLTEEAVRTIVSDAVATIPNLTGDQVRTIVGEEVAKVPVGITATDVSDAIATYMEANPGLSQTDVTNAVSAYMTANPGLTTADLDTAISAATKGLATTEQLTNLENSLAEEIQAARDIGLKGNAAVQAGLDSLAEKVGINQADLLEQLGTTEENLQTQFAEGIESLDTKLTNAIADAQAAGEAGDAVIQKAVQAVADELGITKEALLTQLGTTEETLRTEFAAGISGLETQMQEQYDALTTAQRETADALLAQGKTLADAIAEAQETTSGQISDLEAQTTEQYNALTAAQKVTADALVEQGKTLSEAVETARAEAAEQLTDTETRLTNAIAAAEAAGLSRDEAFNSALASVATDLGTTKEALLAQLGTTEETLRAEFSTGLAGVSAEVQAAYNALSAEQKVLANQLTTQGSTLAEAIETVRTETAGQIGALSADMQAKYDSLSAEQKALATNMAQQGMDLTAAINLAQQQTQAQITGLGEQVDARINELMQQGQTYQQATQQAIGELNQQNQQLQGLVGTQGRQATQADIDALTQMLGGQRSMDLSYDVTGDKQITQADIDFLTGVVGGTKTDWTAPDQSPWAATGLYGQIQANERQRQKDLADAAAAAEAQRQADQQAAAEAARMANIRGTASRAQTSAQGIMQQLEAMQRAGMAQRQPAQLVESSAGFDLSNPLNTGFFSGFQSKKPQQNQQPTTKIAAGGYIDDSLAEGMTVDDLLNLLR
jgi:hypothetical protein